jgi:hypothetical protein
MEPILKFSVLSTFEIVLHHYSPFRLFFCRQPRSPSRIENIHSLKHFKSLEISIHTLNQFRHAAARLSTYLAISLVSHSFKIVSDKVARLYAHQHSFGGSNILTAR